MPLLQCTPVPVAGCESVTACRRGMRWSLRYVQQTISPESQSSPLWPSLTWDTRSVQNLRPCGLRVLCFDFVALRVLAPP